MYIGRLYTLLGKMITDAETYFTDAETYFIPFPHGDTVALIPYK